MAKAGSVSLEHVDDGKNAEQEREEAKEDERGDHVGLAGPGGVEENNAPDGDGVRGERDQNEERALKSASQVIPCALALNRPAERLPTYEADKHGDGKPDDAILHQRDLFALSRDSE